MIRKIEKNPMKKYEFNEFNCHDCWHPKKSFPNKGCCIIPNQVATDCSSAHFYRKMAMAFFVN